ncbi:MAG: sigma-70 family RNA polymerase sigma factor [Gammaproteobacteria bacterium]|nr:sigma-70 family RNA polymerase sigma factor [Gammaproteobacteria bacterium]
MEDDQSKHLVRACKSGDRKAFDALVGLYQKPVFNAVYRMLNNVEEARDVTQTVFLKVFENLHGYDESYKFFSWIYRIAINEAINQQAGHRDDRQLHEDMEGQEDPQRDAGHCEMQQGIEVALMKISADHRSVIVLKHLLDFSYQEISEILQLPEKTVKSRLYDARDRLRELLNKESFL